MAASGGMFGGGVYQRVPWPPDPALALVRVRNHARTIRGAAQVPSSGGRWKALGYTFDPVRATLSALVQRITESGMPEILTESFCERCGTRYTFESAAPRAARLKGMRVLSRGLKNFVMSDDSSLDEAMAAARSDTEREVTSQQLDAFHKTFNFCMQCRQYTCANCWNDADGRCLTCAPHLGHDILAAPFPDLEVGSTIDLRVAPNGNGSNGHHHAHDPSLDALAWPTSDVTDHSEPGTDPIAWATDEPAASVEASPVDAVPADGPFAAHDQIDDPTVEPTVGATDVAHPPAFAEPGPAASDTGIDDRAAAASAATARLLQSFRPGQSLDDALDAYERDRATADARPDVEPATTIAPEATVEPGEIAPIEAEPTAAVESEPVQAEPVEAEQPVGAVPASAVPTPDPAPTPVDRVEQPTWRIVAPDQTGSDSAVTPSDAPPTPPAAPVAEPEWPSKPEWPAPGAAAGLPFLGRLATPTGGIEALWAESAREVSTVPASGPAANADAKATGGVQPCISCGLSLSANARFCRRCGSRQG